MRKRLRSSATGSRADGAPVRPGEGGFKAEPGRYHLYVSLACPWAHRTLIFRKLKGLEGMIGVSVVHWLMAEHGWTFEQAPGRHRRRAPRPPLPARGLRPRPSRTIPAGSPCRCSGTRQRGTIVNNEFVRDHPDAELGVRRRRRGAGRLLPGAAARREIDAVNERVYATVNNGVYRAGFATTQAAYDEAVDRAVRDASTGSRSGSSGQRYLAGDRVTEADWRLFTTLLRFDPVYHGHFKCNLRRLVDYPHLWAYTRELYQWPGVAETVDFAHIKSHYYASHGTINPTGIVPMGPLLDWPSRTAGIGLPAQRRPPRPEIVTCGEHGCELRRDSVGLGCCWC